MRQILFAQDCAKHVQTTCQRGGKWNLVVRFLQLVIASPEQALVVLSLELRLVAAHLTVELTGSCGP